MLHIFLCRNVHLDEIAFSVVAKSGNKSLFTISYLETNGFHFCDPDVFHKPFPSPWEFCDSSSINKLYQFARNTTLDFIHFLWN